jgi:uncharacterized protein (DUF2236 family)
MLQSSKNRQKTVAPHRDNELALEIVRMMQKKTISPISERLFWPDTMIWRVDREMVLLAAGGRALLMQLAHPKVAAGVAEHSHFKGDPLGRLSRTMSTMWSIGFDETALARAALARVRNVHRKVQGTIPVTEALVAGTPYDAVDVELLFWVHATLIDSAMVAYDIFVKPLSSDEKSRYYDDSKKLAYLFEIPETILPASLADFNGYMERMLRSDEIAVGPTARSLAEEILYPSLWILKPASPLFRLITAGLLPECLRDAYGLGWSEPKEKAFCLIAKWVRRLLPLVPKPLRVVPNARAAEKNLPGRHRNLPGIGSPTHPT